MTEVLFSFVGNHDPYGDADGNFGPVLSLLDARQFDRVVLFCTGSEYVERAREVEERAQSFGEAITFSFVDISLSSPIDYEEIYRELTGAIDQYLPELSAGEHRISVLLDPGTPPMQTSWFLLVASGYMDARLLQGVPPRFGGGMYQVRRVELDRSNLPKVQPARPEATTAGSARATEGRRLWIQSSETRVIGDAAAARELTGKILQVAKYHVSVLILGETGSGKEIISRLLHEESPRRNGPFVPVNCASISAALAESELFGHAKGAFTGANTRRLGQFRAASGGTLLLDEVGDLPLEIQPKLLRALEEQTVTPVGADEPVKVDVRVLAATNHDLEERISQGLFRRDLYERLNQVPVRLPPLRERSEDIPLLVREFLAEWNEKYHEEKGLSEETMAMLLEYPWPGNIRELKNAVMTLCAGGTSREIGPNLLPHQILSYFNRERRTEETAVRLPEEGIDLKSELFRLERAYFVHALERSGGNREQAARLLGLNPPAFRKAARERFDL